MSALGLVLADALIDDLASRFPGLMEPAHVNGESVAPVTRHHDNALRGTAAHPVSHSDVVLAALVNELRERDRDFLAARHLAVPVAQPVHLLSLDEDGHIESRVAARVGEGEGVTFFIPLADPLNVRWISLLQGLTLDERVRVLTELVRIFGDLVRFHGLGEGFVGDLVGLLRLAVSEAREHPSGHSDERRDTDSYPFGHDITLGGAV